MLLRNSLQQHHLVAVWRVITSRVAVLEESSGGNTIQTKAPDTVILEHLPLKLALGGATPPCRCVIDAAAPMLLRNSLQQHHLVAVWRMITSRVAVLEESSGGNTIQTKAPDSVTLEHFPLKLGIDLRKRS
ncbi:hypothetical protein Y032_0155g3041 [Ancylostoma ceylanicum]|uniref:Uncharacterized protein n=1 Tax=Ancylostoma ceylanicum TaxID=53326 RepID=A0A016SZC6_9BILA|nr:hypothetical protein Y032_0155g3041 [Ancylostoma ceylanicum]